MNNLKEIREIYGATQEVVAAAINVNRVTVANWENGNSVASGSNQEKLSIYYGIGPEFFYEKPLTEDAKKLILQTSAHAREVVEKSNGVRSKEKDFHEMFESLSFSEAINRYIFSMKLLLATTDKADLEKLKIAALVNEKMGNRLQAVIKMREEEEADPNQKSLYDLLEEISEDK